MYYLFIFNILWIFWDKLLKMFSCSSNIYLNHVRRSLSFSPRHDYHDISVSCESINVCSEMRIFNFHALKLSVSFWTANLELLHNVGYSLISVTVILIRSITKNTNIQLQQERKREISTAYPKSETWDISKKVAFSNKTTSSAPHNLLNCCNCDSSWSTFGIREYTIWDQALYKVSSQIDVAKDRILKL